MTTEARAILQQALRLATVERAELIDALFRSLGKGTSHDTDALWADEAESRIDAYETGELTADSADAVVRRIGNR